MSVPTSGCLAPLVTRQLPVEHWHELTGDPTFGDAILDHLVHGAQRLTLERPVDPPPENDQEGNKDETDNEGRKLSPHPHLGAVVRHRPH